MPKKRVSSNVFEDNRSSTRTRSANNSFELNHVPEIDIKSRPSNILSKYLGDYSDDDADNDKPTIAERECKLPDDLKFSALPDELLTDEAYQASQKCPLCDGWLMLGDEIVTHPGGEYDDAYKKWQVHELCVSVD